MYGKILFAACVLLFATQDAWSQNVGTMLDYCRERTVRGNAFGAKCAKVWTFGGTTYRNECTKKNWHEFWCSTTEGAYRNEWGACLPDTCAQQCAKTKGGSAKEAPCVFPFEFRSKNYTSCTSIRHPQMWCATAARYTPSQWGNCQYDTACQPKYCTKRTSGGTGKGLPCTFPFEFKKQTYYDCTSVSHTKPWCAINSTFEPTKLWGNCLSKTCGRLCRYQTKGGNGDRKRCTFPFTYKSKVYENCITANNNGKHWCSTTPDFDKNPAWGNCIFTNSGCPQHCAGRTTGKSSGYGAPCTFPFKYKGKQYTNCTTDGSTLKDEPWCGTTSDYDKDRKWGRCIYAAKCGKLCTDKTTGGVTTADKKACVFPFTYNNKKYNSCTYLDNAGVNWCATTDNYPQDGKWGNCVYTC